MEEVPSGAEAKVQVNLEAPAWVGATLSEGHPMEEVANLEVQGVAHRFHHLEASLGGIEQVETGHNLSRQDGVSHLVAINLPGVVALSKCLVKVAAPEEAFLVVVAIQGNPLDPTTAGLFPGLDLVPTTGAASPGAVLGGLVVTIRAVHHFPGPLLATVEQEAIPHGQAVMLSGRAVAIAAEEAVAATAHGPQAMLSDGVQMAPAPTATAVVGHRRTRVEMQVTPLTDTSAAIPDTSADRAAPRHQDRAEETRERAMLSCFGSSATGVSLQRMASTWPPFPTLSLRQRVM